MSNDGLLWLIIGIAIGYYILSSNIDLRPHKQQSHRSIQQDDSDNDESCPNDDESEQDSTLDNQDESDTDTVALIKKYAAKHHVDPKLFIALVRQESAFNPNAISPVGARGLSQIMPATGKQKCGLSKDDLLEPAKNLNCGAKILKQLLIEFKDVRLALCAYNAGEGKIYELGRCPNFPETQNYANAILAEYQQ